MEENDSAPLVFVSHASEDKERFVMPFAARLRENGVNAWVDKWEINVGDSLVQKIFEEGLKGAQAVVIVLSKYSVEKPWVKKELNAGVVNNINHNCKLLPIVLDGLGKESIPQSLHDLKWISVANPGNFDGVLSEVLQAIFGHYEKPPLGNRPRYASPDFHLIPGLNRVDSAVLKLIGDLVVSSDDPDRYISPSEVQDAAAKMGIGQEQVQESFEILGAEGYLNDSDASIDVYRLTVHGFERYASEYVPGYERVLRHVGAQIANDQEIDLKEIATSYGCSEAVVRHALDWLHERNYIEVVHFYGGGFGIADVSAQLRRWLRSGK